MKKIRRVEISLKFRRQTCQEAACFADEIVTDIFQHTRKPSGSSGQDRDFR